MGLDLIDMVVEVEDAFGIDLATEDCCQIRTVGELHALVSRTLQVDAQGPCLSMVTFHALRNNLMDTCGLSREVIRVDTRLDRLIPSGSRKIAWERLEDRMGLKLPALTLPTVLASVMLASTAGALSAVSVGLVSGMSFGAVVLGLLLIWSKHRAMHWLTSPLANRFHIGIATIGDLTRAVLSSNFATIARRANHAGADEVWRMLRTIINQTMGVREEDIEPHLRFVEDLGA